MMRQWSQNKAWNQQSTVEWVQLKRAFKCSVIERLAFNSMIGKMKIEIEKTFQLLLIQFNFVYQLIPPIFFSDVNWKRSKVGLWIADLITYICKIFFYFMNKKFLLTKRIRNFLKRWQTFFSTHFFKRSSFSNNRMQNKL